jgi:hypothetical protein
MTEPSEVEKFYIERIRNFDEERRRISSYTNLIKRRNSESHTLHWQARQNADIALNSSQELEELVSELHKILDETHEAKAELQNLIDNQITMKSQIDLLSQLSRPVQNDVTYFFEDKFAEASRARASNQRKDSNTSISVPAQSKISLHQLGSQTVMPVPKQVQNCLRIDFCHERRRDRERTGRLNLKTVQLLLLLAKNRRGCSTGAEEEIAELFIILEISGIPVSSSHS